AYSLNLDGPARDDARASFAEIMRVLFGEMRHLRVVNDVLRELEGAAYRPALQVARLVPGGPGGAKRPVQARRLDPAVLDEILNIERPSNSVDGLYARIAATLESKTTSQPLQ